MEDASGIPRKHPMAWIGYALLGVAMCAFLSHSLWMGVRTLNWPAVPCVIEKAEITRHQAWTGIHWVSVRYHYDMTGGKYVSERFSGSRDGTGKSEIMQQYVPGKAATCFVNPQNPSEAVLRKDIRWVDWAVPSFMALGVPVMIACAIRETRIRRREKLTAANPVPSPPPAGRLNCFVVLTKRHTAFHSRPQL